jgi:hypothetical protein
VAGVLTADQKTALEKMKGKEFKLDPSGCGGGRRGAVARAADRAPDRTVSV